MDKNQFDNKFTKTQQDEPLESRQKYSSFFLNIFSEKNSPTPT
jgi:hypothetical protein